MGSWRGKYTYTDVRSPRGPFFLPAVHIQLLAATEDLFLVPRVRYGGKTRPRVRGKRGKRIPLTFKGEQYVRVNAAMLTSKCHVRNM
jgi:hypothetical protein